jgi:hypothetical protein
VPVFRLTPVPTRTRNPLQNPPFELILEKYFKKNKPSSIRNLHPNNPRSNDFHAITRAMLIV